MTKVLKILVLSLLITYAKSYGQKKKIEVAVEFNFFGINAEPRYQITDNSTVGLRLGYIWVLDRYNSTPNDSPYDIEVGYLFDTFNVLHASATYEFKYLTSLNIKFQPFIGGGIGIYALENVDEVRNIATDEVFEGRIKAQPGVLLRGGFELGAFRMGLEYNILPESDIEIPTGAVIGTSRSSFPTFFLGFIIR